MFQKEVDNLENDGQWQSCLCDVLPLAVSNLYKCTVRIFSSNNQTPCYDIKPSFWRLQWRSHKLSIHDCARGGTL